MIRSSKDDFEWFGSCRVGELMCWVKPVEFSKSARSSSISLGEEPGNLKSPEIIRRSAASVPTVARSEPNSSRNIDLLEEGGRYMFASTMSRDWRLMLTSWNSKDEWVMLCLLGKTFISLEHSDWIRKLQRAICKLYPCFALPYSNPFPQINISAPQRSMRSWCIIYFSQCCMEFQSHEYTENVLNINTIVAMMSRSALTLNTGAAMLCRQPFH